MAHVPDEEMVELRGILNELLDLDHGLRSNEVDFIDDMNQWDGNFTVKQAEWLRKIAERLL